MTGSEYMKPQFKNPVSVWKCFHTSITRLFLWRPLFTVKHLTTYERLTLHRPLFSWQTTKLYPNYCTVESVAAVSGFKNEGSQKKFRSTSPQSRTACAADLIAL